jgi:hypothetical protein
MKNKNEKYRLRTPCMCVAQEAFSSAAAGYAALLVQSTDCSGLAQLAASPCATLSDVTVPQLLLLAHSLPR